MIEIVDPNDIIGSYPTLAIIGSQNLTRPAKINHLSAKNLPIFYLRSIITCELAIYTNAIRSLSLLQNLIGFLIKFAQIGYRMVGNFVGLIFRSLESSDYFVGLYFCGVPTLIT